MHHPDTPDGLTIIDISIPESPSKTSVLKDGSGGFDELDGAFGVTIVVIDNITYVLVTSSEDYALTIINIEPLVVSSSTNKTGGDSDGKHKTKPTFGIDPKTYTQRVEDGLIINGESFTVNDNFWTHIPMQNLTIGESQNFTAKVYAQNELKVLEFVFGITEVGKWYESDAAVTFHFDYQALFEKVVITDKKDILDTKKFGFSIKKVPCRTDEVTTNCKQVSMELSFNESPTGKVLGLQAIDHERRTNVLYFNDGINLEGKSLNPAPTEQIISKIKYKGLQTIQRVDKINDIWVPIDENEPVLKYTRNSHGNFIALELKPYVIH